MKRHNRCLTAAITLSALILSGCGETAKSETPDASGVQSEKISFENVYTETELPIELDSLTDHGVKSAWGRVYFNGYVKQEPQQSSDVVQALISCDLTGGDVKTHWEPPPEERTATAAVKDETTLAAFDADAEGCVYLVLSHTHRDYTDERSAVYESTLSLIKLAPDGTEIFNTDLASPEGGELGDIYIQDVLRDAAGNIYLHSRGIHVYTPDGKYSFTVSEQATTYIEAVTTTNDGKVIYAVQGQPGTSRGYFFTPIDAAARSAGAPVKYTGSHYFNGIFPGGGDYLFYYQYQTGIYGMDGATMNGVKLVDFINSDVAFDGNRTFAPIDGGGFVMAPTRFGSMSGGAITVSLLTEDKNASVGEKTVLTLGVLAGNVNHVTRFNGSSNTSRVIIKDYYSEGGAAQLDLDIISSRAPDIICLPAPSSKYASKGVLADLTPFLESGKHGLSREDMFENILELGSADGKLFQIAPSFNIWTLAGKQSVFGERGTVTPAELAAIADEYPDAVIIPDITPYFWLSYELWHCTEDFIDWESGVCSFDSREFIGILEFSKRFPAEIDYSGRYSSQDAFAEYERDIAAAFIEDRALLYRTYTYCGGVRMAHDMDTVFGEKTALIGYPTTGGNGSVIVSDHGFYAISASSPNKEAAWEFICSVIGYEREDGFTRMFGAISVDKRQFEERARQEMLPLEERDFTNGVQVARAHPSGSAREYTLTSPEDIDRTDPFFADYELTEEDIERSLRAIEGADTLYSFDEQISNIVMEEAEAFWAGAKTAEETAKIIQSRVSLYVGESR
ncbi:MAG: hypothetical protein LBK23_03535 [Oscillospiraceae bacterium]|nr:hypothetical protein [Oscillospiraceae bacterium]